MDNSENVAAFDSYAKLNNIIEHTYHCVVDKKKKKKLLHNTRKNYPQASWEGLDTYKYSDYPESGISPQQHVPPAGLPAAGPPAAAGPPVAAAAHPAGGVPHLVPAAAGQVPAAAPLQPVPVAAAAAALPANVADYHPPAEWQDLYPLPLKTRTTASATSLSMPTSQSPTMPTPLILERTRFGWRVKAPRITTPLVWRLVPIPVTPQRHGQPPAPAAQLTPRRLLVSPPHRADPAFSPASPRTQRRPKKARKALKREN